MLGARQHLEVLPPVVRAVAVLVMDDLVLSELASQVTHRHANVLVRV